MFITFYSYKGGVGRSLALANIACLMAEDDKHPQRVLVWDFDLEAPGIHRLFPRKQRQKHGFVDMAYEFATSGTIPEVGDYIYESEVEGVYVLPAGEIGESYCKKLQQINWLGFFGSDPGNTGPFFSKLLEGIKEIENPFDYVLVDSRTGLNDQAGICTQILSDLLIVLFRLSDQNLDGLRHLVPAIKSQLEARGRKEVNILPIASQVGAAASQTGLSKFREKAKKIFGRELEYIRFDQELVSKEKLFCLNDEIEAMWPCPPIVDDYVRICSIIRRENKIDTKTQEKELRFKMHDGDSATASMILLRLLSHRPRLSRAWDSLSRLYQEMTGSRKEEVKKTISEILSRDKTNFFAHRWQAAFKSSEATSPDSDELLEAKKSLNKAIKYAPDKDKGAMYRALASIESCTGELENAVKTLLKVKSLMPENNQVNLDLAKMYLRVGAKYFAAASDELDKIPSDIGIEKYSSLTYIWAFLGEKDKAEVALKSCDEEMGPVVRAHKLLIEGRKDEATKLANEKVSLEKVLSGLANWAEFYLCAEDFEKVFSLTRRRDKSKYDSKNIKFIKSFAEFLMGKKAPSSPEMKKLISNWSKSAWNFRELLMFRECCIRDGKDYQGRFGTIEKVIQFQELESITSSVLGLLGLNLVRTVLTFE